MNDFSEKDFFLLLFIAEKAGLKGKLSASTSEIAFSLNISQQSVSRKLSFLASKNLIERKVLPSGNILSLSEKGIQVLSKKRNVLEKLFSQKTKQKFSGKVCSGLGEGKYYINLSGYQNQFKKILGEKVFPGTLNLKVNELEFNDFLSSKKEILIQGFSSKNRTFGTASLFKVKLNSVDAAIIVPERTNHPKGIIEVISSFFLRKKLKLKDNSSVTLF